MTDSIAAVDLFCGAGGLTHGLIKAGIPVKAGIDLDESCRYAYETNNAATFICKDTRDIKPDEMTGFFADSEIKVLVGCAPCQCFSKHTQKNKQRDKDDKWKLLYSFAKVVESVQPHVISMENVVEISKQEVFTDFVKTLEANNYHVSHSSVYCPDYGIPQKRSRLVLLASKLGPIHLISKTHTKSKYRTVRNTIANLEPIEAGQISTKDPMHRTSSLTPLNQKRILQSKPGGTWRDWDEELISPCHKKDTGQSYDAIYGRMCWDKPAPTITTQFNTFGTGRFGHPEQNRGLSFREGALLQTFPRTYKFFPSKGKVYVRQLGKHIGNAVPVRLGKIIGTSILKHVESHSR